MEIDGKTCGVVYMAFGENSANAVKRSYETITKYNSNLGVIVIGSHRVENIGFKEWHGDTPWQSVGHIRQRFYAGEVKPFLIDYTPFEYTLYLDADTECLGDLTRGFEKLIEYDIAAAYPGNLKKHAKQPEPLWTIFNRENDFTYKYLKGMVNNYVNSGVIFFRKNDITKIFFRAWYIQWLKFRNWDEQFSFIRTEYDHPEAKILHLPKEWNTNKKESAIIFHAWGKEAARDLRK